MNYLHISFHSIFLLCIPFADPRNGATPLYFPPCHPHFPHRNCSNPSDSVKNNVHKDFSLESNVDSFATIV